MRLYVVTFHSGDGTTFGHWLIARLSQLDIIVDWLARSYQLALSELAEVAQRDELLLPLRNVPVGLNEAEQFYVTITPCDPEAEVVLL